MLALYEEMTALQRSILGLRDEYLLESALAKPRRLYAYSPSDIFSLAASYAYGLCKNHPFVDGNKRIAFLICNLFLEQSGHRLIASKERKVEIFLKLANNALSEEELGQWLKHNSSPTNLDQQELQKEALKH